MSIYRYIPRTADGQPRSLDSIHDPRAKRWYETLYQRTPPWVTLGMLADVYLRAKRLRRLGFSVEVDHIVPLRHPLVCGLHVPANLQIISRRTNRFKSNDRYPGHPQVELFSDPLEPEQYPLGFAADSYQYATSPLKSIRRKSRK